MYGVVFGGYCGVVDVGDCVVFDVFFEVVCLCWCGYCGICCDCVDCDYFGCDCVVRFLVRCVGCVLIGVLVVGLV